MAAYLMLASQAYLDQNFLVLYLEHWRAPQARELKAPPLQQLEFDVRPIGDKRAWNPRTC